MVVAVACREVFRESWVLVRRLSVAVHLETKGEMLYESILCIIIDIAS